jgi:hypothetical protein
MADFLSIMGNISPLFQDMRALPAIVFPFVKLFGNTKFCL